MAENPEVLPVSPIEKPSSETIDVTEKEMLKQIIENQQKILKKLQLIESEKSGKKQQEYGSSEDSVTKIDMKNPNEDVASHTDNQMQNSIFEKTGKWFVMKYTFKNVPELEEGERVFSEEQEHIGVTWRMNARRSGKHLELFIWCANKTATRLWSIETDHKVKLLSKNGSPIIRSDCQVYKPVNIETVKEYDNWGWKEFADWEEVMKNNVIDDCLTFEVTFKIKNTNGIYKDNLRCFDDPECSDVVLIAQNKKFHVLKLYLAAHSSYFKSMFLGMFSDSNKSEILLTGVDADDFQNYLEVLYGEYAINEYTVEGLLLVADMYDTQIVVRKCEEFLLEKSYKTSMKKLEFSVRYRLENLKKQCLSQIRDSDDDCELDHSLIADLLEKSLATS